MIKISDVRNMIRKRQRVVIARKTATLKEGIAFEKEKSDLRKLKEDKIKIQKKHRPNESRLKKIKKVIDNANNGMNNNFLVGDTKKDNRPYWLK